MSKTKQRGKGKLITSDVAVDELLQRALRREPDQAYHHGIRKDGRNLFGREWATLTIEERKWVLRRINVVTGEVNSTVGEKLLRLVRELPVREL